MPTTEAAIHISISDQRLQLRRRRRKMLEFPVSTARAGIGFEPGSLCTPWGRFSIYAKIGHGAPPGTIFQSRAPTGEIGSPDSPEDLVQTRILWLDGLDAANANTLGRYIYIHGTNHEESIGTPASHGCIRMRNAEVARLFEEVDTGALVVIQP